MREMGLSSHYIDIEYEGDKFPSIAVCEDEVAQIMNPALAHVTGYDVQILHSYFKMSGENVNRGEENKFFAHWDDEPAPFVAVFHLNEAPYAVGGTAFWRHVPSGWTSTKDLPAHSATMEQLVRDRQESLAWELHTLVGSQWNRLTIYRSDLIHSQWPIRGYGSNKEESRLVWVCFFLMP